MSGHRSGLPSNYNLLQQHTPYPRHPHDHGHGHVHHFRFRHHSVCAGSTLNISFFILLGTAVILLSVLVAYLGIWIHRSRNTARNTQAAGRHSESEEDSLLGLKEEISFMDGEALPPYEAPPPEYGVELEGVVVESIGGDVKG